MINGSASSSRLSSSVDPTFLSIALGFFMWNELDVIYLDAYVLATVAAVVVS